MIAPKPTCGRRWWGVVFKVLGKVPGESEVSWGLKAD